jgi:sec-independent protein translocase protein TatB
MFDIGIEKFGLLLVLALIIFGPEQLPRLLRQVGQTLRYMRRLANDVTDDLKAGLGPEYADMDITDLRPRSLIKKHLLDDVDEPAPAETPKIPEPVLASGERPPYDAEAT